MRFVLFAATTTVIAIAFAACGSSSGSAPDQRVATRDSAIRDNANSDASVDVGSSDWNTDASSDARPDAVAPKDTTTPPADVLYIPKDTQPTPDSNGKPELQVLILAGQSNMVGLGYNNKVKGAEAGKVPNATIYYNDGVHSNPNAETLLPLGPGFGVSSSRFGPELGLGHRLRTLWPGRPFVLIKVAEGGTDLDKDWRAHTGYMYKLMIAEIQNQLAGFYQSWQPRLAGLIWMQGESDGCSKSDANAYQGRFADFIAAVRQDLKAPTLPVVAALIAPISTWPHADIVRAGTAALATPFPPIEVVETADLPQDLQDEGHYDTTGSLHLGRRFADALAACHASQWHYEGDFSAIRPTAGWRYQHRLGSDSQPMTYDLATHRWGGPEPALLIGDGWMHPGPKRQAETIWKARRAGLMNIKVRAEAADNGGGDGTWVEIAKNGTALWGPKAVANKTSVQHELQIVMLAGEELHFRTSAGPANDNAHDTTLWQIDIAFVGP